MEKGCVPGVYHEVRVDRHRLVGDGQIAYVCGDMAVCVVQDQGLYSVSLESDGSFHLIKTVESEQSCLGLPFGFFIGSADCYLHCTGAAQFFLLQGEYGFLGVILIHVHVIGQQLERCGGICYKNIPVTVHSEPLNHRHSFVTAFIIVTNRMLCAVLPEAVCKTTFVGYVGRQDIGQAQAFIADIHPFPSQGKTVIGIAETVLVSVGVVAVCVAESG